MQLHPLGRCRTAGSLLACLQVLDALKTKGISIRVASPKLVMEEAPESYKVGISLPLAACSAGTADGLPAPGPIYGQSPAEATTFGQQSAAAIQA